MEIKILERKKGRLHFELKGEGHTLSNLLRSSLWQVKDTKSAAYALKHPLLAVPEIILETAADEGEDTAIKGAEIIKKQNKEFLAQFKKEAK